MSPCGVIKFGSAISCVFDFVQWSYMHAYMQTYLPGAPSYHIHTYRDTCLHTHHTPLLKPPFPTLVWCPAMHFFFQGHEHVFPPHNHSNVACQCVTPHVNKSLHKIRHDTYTSTDECVLAHLLQRTSPRVSTPSSSCYIRLQHVIHHGAHERVMHA